MIEATVRADADRNVAVQGGTSELIRTVTYRYRQWGSARGSSTAPTRQSGVAGRESGPVAGHLAAWRGRCGSPSVGRPGSVSAELGVSADRSRPTVVARTPGKDQRRQRGRRDGRSLVLLAYLHRLHLQFTPIRSFWLNQGFGLLTDKQLRRGVHESPQSLERTSGSGSGTGRTTRDRSSGPRPLTRSSDDSTHLSAPSTSTRASSTVPLQGIPGAGR